jgi:hypothetical protein
MLGEEHNGVSIASGIFVRRSTVFGARGSLSYLSLISAGDPRATYGGLETPLSRREAPLRPLLYSPGHSALHATAGDFSSPAPLVTVMPKTLLGLFKKAPAL